MKKILISTSSFGTAGLKPLQDLKKAGFSVTLNPHKRRLTTEESIQLLQGMVGVIAGTERLDESVFQHTPDLQVISRCGSGMDSVDIPAAQKRNIQVLNTPNAPVDAVAELTLSLMLGVLRKVAEADRSVRASAWKPLFGNLLRHKTVGLIGLGRIGRRVVELLKPFDVTVLACEKYPNLPFMKKHHVRRVPLSALLKKSDVVSLHVNLDASTRNMLGKSEFLKMKKTAVLVNVARGELLDSAALAEVLQSGHLAGAALDVYEKEPYQGPLQACPNTLLTCHMGSYAAETRLSMEQEAAENLIQAFRGRREKIR